jgi:primosomal protein N' (replication factor Y)
MKLVHVIPISRGVGKETLTYFTARKAEPGSIVSVPLRKRIVPALVLFTQEAENVKTAIRSSEYAVKKVAQVNSSYFFHPAFIEMIRDVAHYFAGTPGGVLHALVPNTILEELNKVKPPKKEAGAARYDPPEQFVIQADEEERLTHYKSLIREEFARGASVFFILPTIQDAERIANALSKGIEQYSFVLHGSLPKKELILRWRAAVRKPHPVLIIATGKFLGLPRYDIGSVIVEKEASRTYKTAVRPFVDIRVCAELLSRHMGARFLAGDTLLRTETIWRYEHGELLELSPLKFRFLSAASQAIVDMRTYRGSIGKPFVVIGDELKTLIEKNKKENEHLFLFTVRRGLAPITVCGDCGSVVLCAQCNAPVVLHKAERLNIFLCHKCGVGRDANERCKTCTSWKLISLGIGIELVEKSLKEMFPDVKCFKIDRDTVKTHKKGAAITETFFSSPGSVLLGTEAALSYLTRTIENAAVVSLDSLFAVPDFRMNEKIINLLLAIRSRCSHTFILQTRNVGRTVLDYALSGNLIGFYREEIKERKQFKHPPFVVLIKITREGRQETVVKDMDKLREHLQAFSPQIFPAFITRVKGAYRMNALVKVSRESWPNKELVERLRSLPAQFAVNVDPDSVL